MRLVYHLSLFSVKKGALGHGVRIKVVSRVWIRGGGHVIEKVVR